MNNNEMLTKIKQIDAIEQLLLNKFPTTYVQPTLSISCNKVKFELGTTINPTISAKFTQNDAGVVTKYKLLKGTTTVKEANAISDHIEPAFKLTGDVQYKAEVTYEAGVIKKDSLGNPCPQGQIPSGTISESITLSAVRAAWGYVSDSADIPTADNVRKTAVTDIGLQHGSTIKAVAKAGTTRTIIFAYPEALRDCSKIKYEELGDNENKTAFKQKILSIPDFSGENHVNYRVYYYTAPVPFKSTATFTLTI